jgi:photosystem II stability/assembly factor-like uncharacterized protein
MNTLRPVWPLTLLAAVAATLPAAWADAPVINPVGDVALQALQWRLAGPFRGGRVDAVAGIPGDRNTFYMGAADGGIWKTSDAGHHWNNVSDCCLDAGPVGALAVAASDPMVVYAGTGEPFPRGDVLTGDGVWKSTDAGKTWVNVGLKDTHIISNISVDPTDPQHVYVGAMGHLFGQNPERGVYESKDGGGHWQRILFVDADTGTADLVMDPADPKTLYAALWQVERRPWDFSSGGPGSGIWKTSDGGGHWTDLSHNPGLPAGVLGRIGLVLPQTAKDRVYAVVEASEGGLYRSDDAGAHWQRLYKKGDLNMRAWYFSRIYADTKDADHLWVSEAPGFMVSKDGGKTFKSQYLIGGDHHVMWIDPTEPKTMIIGNDGGASISLDGGASWSTEDNQPTAQLYHINVDERFPFHMYGAQQDLSTIEVPSASPEWGIDVHDWRTDAQWEAGYAVPVPGQPWIVYSSGGPMGALERTDTRTDLKTFLIAWPDDNTGRGAKELKYRFQWTFPIVASRHQPDTLYVGSQYVMKSADSGHSWRVISPDLTRDDKEKQQPSGGPLHKDITAVEYYDTVFALAESPLQSGLLWAGSDDGRVWVTKDDGGHWDEVTPPDLPAWSTVNVIDPSRFEPGTAFMAAHRYRLDDFAPYIYVTHDYGQHWQKIVSGLAQDTSSFAVRQDWQDPKLLFAGTLNGAWYSDDEGAHWRSLQQNLPHAAVTDLAVIPQQDSLAVATHGRAFWVLDQLQPLRELDAKARKADAFLHTPGTAWITGGSQDPTALQFSQGMNPQNGAQIYYQLKKPLAAGAKLTLAITDLQGHPVTSFSVTGKPAKKDHDADADKDKDKDADEQPALLGTDAGMNLFVWDLSYAAVGKGDEAVPGPPVLPGCYRASLTHDGRSQSREFEVRMDPRVQVSDAALKARTDFGFMVQKKLAEVGLAAAHIEALRKALKTSKAPDAPARLAKLEDIAGRLLVPNFDGYLEMLAHPVSLQGRLGTILFGVDGDYAAPPPAYRELYDSLAAQADAEMQALHAFDDLHVHDPEALVRHHPAVRSGLAQQREDRD